MIEEHPKNYQVLAFDHAEPIKSRMDKDSCASTCNFVHIRTPGYPQLSFATFMDSGRDRLGSGKGTESLLSKLLSLGLEPSSYFGRMVERRLSGNALC